MKWLCDLADGLYPDLPHATYHDRSQHVVSKSGLDEFERSPMHYQTWRKTPDHETPALTFGRVFHCALLEPERFAATYARQPDFGDMRTKAAKAARDAWLDENAGRTPIEPDDWETIDRMVSAVRAHKLASKMIVGGQSEVTALWTDPATGLRCKSRMDYYVPARAMVVDAKSCIDASHKGFKKAIFNHGYHRQHALYREGLAVLGHPAEHFVFLAVEKTPPYGVALYTIDDRGVDAAYQSIRRNIDELARCIRLDVWAGYNDEHIQTIETPPWAA